jgi:hypothetical protein
LCDWLWDGPPAAHVTAVEAQVVEVASLAEWPSSFRTG